MAGLPVTIDGLYKSFGETRAVDDVSLTLEAGEFVSLLGSSGSGKTTTLMIVAGFVEPDAGHVLIGDRTIDGLPPERRDLGVVFQSYALFPHMNVFENIAFPLRMRNRASGEIKAKVGEVLGLVELEALAGRKVQQLSGGQQQRVALARALVYEPPVLLLDEPLGALDRKLRDQLQSEIKRIQRELGVTVLYVTHDQEEALSMSDRIAVMSGGRIDQIGTPDEVYEVPKTPFVAGFLGESNFFEGAVTGSGDTARLTVTRSGAGLELAGRFAAHAFSGAGRGMVRPESLAIGDAAWTRENAVEGRIDLREHLGPVLRLTVATPLGRIAAKVSRTGSATQLGPGDAVTLGWNAEDMLVFKD